MDAPTDPLVRARPGIEYRSDSDGLPTLFGHFSVFDRWTEIDSWYEGRFLERIAKGAFADTIREDLERMKVLYDHGHDPTLGNKPLGPIQTLREDKVGAFYEVPLIDTDYNRNFIVPAVEAGLLGASFRFVVTAEEWDEKPGTSDHNPQGLPERTITKAEVREFGPVTFPAYVEGTTAGLRSISMTDQYIEAALRLDLVDGDDIASRAARHPLIRSLAARSAGQGADDSGHEGGGTEEPSVAGVERSGTPTINRFQARARLANI